MRVQGSATPAWSAAIILSILSHPRQLSSSAAHWGVKPVVCRTNWMKFHLQNFRRFPEQDRSSNLSGGEIFCPSSYSTLRTQLLSARRTLQMWRGICRDIIALEAFHRFRLNWSEGQPALKDVFRFPLGHSKLFLRACHPALTPTGSGTPTMAGPAEELDFNSMSIQLIKWFNRSKCCSHYEHKELVWLI